MAGELYDAAVPRNFIPKDSHAYCEGMEHRTKGTGAAFPITDNPHQAGSARFDAWGLGWTTADTAAGGTIGAAALCCPFNDTVVTV